MLSDTIPPEGHVDEVGCWCGPTVHPVSGLGHTLTVTGPVGRPSEPAAATGADLIADERQRQIDEEGWSPEHDAEHGEGILSMAAVCYALPPTERRPRHVFSFWPWHSSYWKPTPDDRVRELVKAGALIAAEIDRLQASR